MPSLETLRPQKMQRQVDKRIRALERSSQSSGNEKVQKLKSKRGGNIDIIVKEKVSWPHEPILGGMQRQRISYDQLSLTQWIQGFCRNILEENSGCYGVVHGRSHGGRHWLLARRESSSRCDALWDGKGRPHMRRHRTHRQNTMCSCAEAL